MKEEKDDVIERLTREFLNGRGEEKKKAPEEEKIMEEYKEPEEWLYPKEKKEPSFKIPEPTFEMPSFEEPAIETSAPSEPPRPSDEKIEEILTKLKEEERGIKVLSQLKREEEEEEEEFPEIPEIEEEEILVKKPKRRKPGGRFIKFAILGCIVGGIIGGTFYLGKNYAKPIINFININVTNKIKPSCDLIVSSTPTSCDVFVDDIFKGKSPITIKKLLFGAHNIRIEKEGFKPYISIVNVTSREPINVIANLEEEVKIQEEEAIPVGTATLIVKTNPKTSLVYIKGRLAEMPSILLSGTYSIEVVKDGFFSSKRIIEIKPGEVKEVFVQLKPRFGSIFIDSAPRGCDIVFDGSFKRKTPLILSNISPWKPYKVTIRKKGYFDWNGTTFVEPTQRTKIMALMKKKEEGVSYEKKEAIMERREKEVRFVPKEPFYEIKEALPEISELERIIDRFKEKMEVSTPQIPKEKPKPQITGAPGTCFITSTPPSADIFLDGRFIGKTPIRDFIISEGHYRLKACLQGFKEQEKEIIVRGDTPNFFNFSLKK